MDAVLVYDGDCRVCIAAKRFVKAFDWGRRIRTVPVQHSDATRLLANLDPDRRMSAFHVVVDGRTSSGGDGVLELLGVLSLGGGTLEFAADMPTLRRMSARMYAMLHRVRDRLQCGA